MPTLTTEKRRELEAELELLRIYDTNRIRAGHDFGNGQRGSELMRRQRELDAGKTLAERDAEVIEDPPELEELEEAFERIGRPRLRRALADAERYGSTGAIRTAQTWRRMERAYGQKIERGPLEEV